MVAIPVVLNLSGGGIFVTGDKVMEATIQRTFRPELYRKLNSWVNKCGGDRAFANRINEAPRTIKELVYSSPKLMKRFGFTQ